MNDDIRIARLYLNKVKNAKDRDIEFDLSFAQFKRIYLTKRCYYTGIEMTRLTEDTEHHSPKFHHLSIERIDANKGYVPGNVVACCNGVNKFKGRLENDDDPLTFAMIEKMVKKWKKALDKG